MSEMPKFDFSKATLKTNSELAGKADNGKFLRPGRHEVTVQAVENAGIDKNDPNWFQLKVTLKGTGDKTITDYVKIPMRDNVYGQYKSLKPFKRLINLVKGLGADLTVETAGTVLPSLFERAEKLVGRGLAVEVGYENAYGKYVKTDEGAHIEIVKTDGQTVNDLATGRPLRFPDSKAAEAHAKGVNIRFDAFTRVLSYDKSATASAPKAANGNW